MLVFTHLKDRIQKFQELLEKTIYTWLTCRIHIHNIHSPQCIQQINLKLNLTDQKCALKFLESEQKQNNSHFRIDCKLYFRQFNGNVVEFLWKSIGDAQNQFAEASKSSSIVSFNRKTRKQTNAVL